jgi:hypothetical protein
MTVTDTTEIDALLDALEARAAERAAARPLYNAAGQAVTPLAAANGRLIVNPGDTIASLWGNTTYDQTAQCYASTTDRDTQWPTPHDGALAYTVDTQAMWLRRQGSWQPLAGATVAARAPLGQITMAVAMTVLPPGTPTFDTSPAGFSAAGYTVRTAGTYLVTCAAALAGIPTANGPIMQLQRNGGVISVVSITNNFTGPWTAGLDICDLVQCAAGDVLRVTVGQATGGTAGGGNGSFFSLVRMGV